MNLEQLKAILCSDYNDYTHEIGVAESFIEEAKKFNDKEGQSIWRNYKRYYEGMNQEIKRIARLAGIDLFLEA